MSEMFSSANERKIVTAYIRSNIFFPQLRFAFILALGRDSDLHLLDEIHRCAVSPDTVIENIILAGDRTHARYGVVTVLPTKPNRVLEELSKSVEVFERFVGNLHVALASDECLSQDFGRLVRESSRKFWDLSANSEFSASHLAHVSDPDSTAPKIAIRKVSPQQHPSSRALYEHLVNNCVSTFERRFVEQLRIEIDHPLTIMRPASDALDRQTP
jgi:hypothetical protein